MNYKSVTANISDELFNHLSRISNLHNATIEQVIEEKVFFPLNMSILNYEIQIPLNLYKSVLFAVNNQKREIKKAIMNAYKAALTFFKEPYEDKLFYYVLIDSNNNIFVKKSTFINCEDYVTEVDSNQVFILSCIEEIDILHLFSRGTEAEFTDTVFFDELESTQLGNFFDWINKNTNRRVAYTRCLLKHQIGFSAFKFPHKEALYYMKQWDEEYFNKTKENIITVFMESDYAKIRIDNDYKKVFETFFSNEFKILDQPDNSHLYE